MMKVGVLDVQGDVTEHLQALKRAASKRAVDAEVVSVRTPYAIGSLDALVIPGGESTTVGALITEYGLDEAIREAAERMPVFGTCAGLVLLAKEGDNMKEGQRLLGLMDAKVERNAFGRQRDSFEAVLDIPALGNGGFRGVFIRAPAIKEVGAGVESLASLDGNIVLARQGNIMAAAFHPELTEDTRLHEYFLGMI